MVKDSKLSLHEATKVSTLFYLFIKIYKYYLYFQSQLPGFCDTCLGENKMLHIQYSFRGNMHEVTIQDNEVLRIPKPGIYDIYLYYIYVIIFAFTFSTSCHNYLIINKNLKNVVQIIVYNLENREGIPVYCKLVYFVIIIV